MTRQSEEIESLPQWDAHVAHARTLAGWFVQSVDLSERRDDLARVDPAGAIFLGCTLTDEQISNLRARGALVFPRLPDVPFNPYRAGLYDADELLGPPGSGYADTVDARVYAWTRNPRHPLATTLATALHDHSITDALDGATADILPTDLVGVMGGHSLRRGEQGFADAARLGADLTRGGKTILTGGGPGAMEAANLGAWMAGYSPAELDEACDALAATPSFRPSVAAWVEGAKAVRERWPKGGRSFGIPTWFYGHEPPNAFATDIAKYFANALREDTLLHRCRGGIVYLGGAAGTVQEIFQAVTENYYAADESLVAPMILIGERYWTEHLPAWPLLESLADCRPMARSIHLVDSVDEAVRVLLHD